MPNETEQNVKLATRAIKDALEKLESAWTFAERIALMSPKPAHDFGPSRASIIVNDLSEAKRLCESAIDKLSRVR